MSPKKKKKPMPPLDDDYGRLLPLPRVQEILMCSRQKIYQLYQAGTLKLVKFGGQTRVTDDSLRAMMTNLEPAELKRSYARKTKMRSPGVP